MAYEHRALIFLFLICLTKPTIKDLSQDCLCDVSYTCDQVCCCDPDCPAALVNSWNNYTLCANDGYVIPICTEFYSQPMHTHDLYQGLRLIYTIIKRLFCISKVNFFNPTTSYVSTTTDSQISTTTSSVGAVSLNILSLANISAYKALAFRNSQGTCSQGVLQYMNSVKDKICRVYISSVADINSNPLLSISAFVNNNSLDSSLLQLFSMEIATSPTPPTTNFNLASSTSCVNSTCLVIKEFKLYFIASGSSATIDYAASYIVMGSTKVSPNSYIAIKYSYVFEMQAKTFPYNSYQAYTLGSSLSLIKSSNNGTNINYYRVDNPVNLAYININAQCNSTVADQASLVNLRFGVNTIHSCYGISSNIFTNLQQAFDYIGSLGSSSTNLNDYVQVSFGTISDNQNIKLAIYYVKIGSFSNPQYQIVKASVSAVRKTANKQQSLFVQYLAIASYVALNVPNPPVINAYLPDDFLYPFYVV